jgi:hypothetical protein
MRENRESWRRFYSVRAVLKRLRGSLSYLPLGGKLFYAIACFGFMSLYPNGIAADNVRKHNLGLLDRFCIRAAIAFTRMTRDWFRIRRPRTASYPREVFAPEHHHDALEPGLLSMTAFKTSVESKRVAMSSRGAQ